ncbi:MAG: hypothetical protein AB1486_02125 [Planctomycetota bacterium]
MKPLSFSWLLAASIAGLGPMLCAQGGKRALVDTDCEPPLEPSTFVAIPVTEVTVFKDGHAFLLHEGAIPTDPDGNVVFDHLPAPVLGTFWPYSADSRVKLKAVRAGRRRIEVERTSLDIPQLLEGNVGAEVLITTTFGENLRATIAGVPTRTSEELTASGPPGARESLPQRSNLILLRHVDGVRVLPIDQIRDVTFLSPMQPKFRQEEYRNLLTLDLEWPDGPAETAEVGLVYLQKGIRWIPNYRITIDGAGRAVVELQATLVNELVDLDDVTMHLVIGVPQFTFKDTLDPIALQEEVAQLSQYFQEGTRAQYAFSNAIMSQAARMREVVADVSSGEAAAGPELTEMNRNEDSFVFMIEHVTLRRGERMLMPVVRYELAYADLYTLDLPFAPPPDVYQNFNSQQRIELAQLLGRPKVMHKIRLSNRSQYPLTTAPALIMRDGRLLAQGMTTYTAIGGSSDVTITAAVDIKVDKVEREKQRTPNEVRFSGHDYTKVEMEGTITLTNYRGSAVEVEVEVTRHVLGNVDHCDHDGVISGLNVFEDDSFFVQGDQPYWWSWYGWPWWWYHFNGIGQVSWTVTLEQGQETALGYAWHYYWQ